MAGKFISDLDCSQSDFCLRDMELEDLGAWQEARKLCIGIYEITKTFPKEEKYNIIKHYNI